MCNPNLVSRIIYLGSIFHGLTRSEVRDKKSANFCDYFEPSENAYRPGEYEADLAARDALSALFGNSAPAQGKPVDTTPEADAEAESDADTPSAIDQAKALFKD
jgi:hypothetical protein